jgi:hypothetical protein
LKINVVGQIELKTSHRSRREIKTFSRRSPPSTERPEIHRHVAGSVAGVSGYEYDVALVSLDTRFLTKNGSGRPGAKNPSAQFWRRKISSSSRMASRRMENARRRVCLGNLRAVDGLAISGLQPGSFGFHLDRPRHPDESKVEPVKR